MKIALIQPKQNELYDFERTDRIFSLKEVQCLTAEMIEQTFGLMETVTGADFVVTTEAVNFPGPEKRIDAPYSQCVDETPLLKRFSDYARQHYCYVLAAVYAHHGQGIVNEAVVFDRAGRQADTYIKTHLAGDEQKSLVPGNRYCILDADFGRVGICICWDMQFPEVCRYYALQGCRFVVCPTWGWESIYAHSRAYENGIWVAGAMSVPFRTPIEGIRTPSEVVAPDGSVRACASRISAEALICDIDFDEMQELQILRMKDRRPDTYGFLTCSRN